MIWQYLIEAPWITFAAYWLAGALKTHRTVSRESFASRFGALFLEILGFVLLFSDKAGIGVLGDRFLYRSHPQLTMGVALTWIGIAIAIWARWHLGQYWSARVTVKENHALIRTGPYARIRHPIYSGINLAAIGSALATGKWRCLLGVGLIVLGYWIKARKEESMLAGQFGTTFDEHRRRTGFLLPKFP